MPVHKSERIPDDQRLLTGKRKSIREPLRLDLELVCTNGARYRGRTVDVSRGGMLVELTDKSFGEGDADGADAFLVLMARVMVQFADGVHVRCSALETRPRAHLVRVVTRPENLAFLLGCRFEPSLGPDDCSKLGLDPEADETKVEAILTVPISDRARSSKSSRAAG